jgi:CBS-domain-containing membrane protein
MEEHKVKDLMNPISEYNTIDVNANFCEALSILKGNYEKAKTGKTGAFHKTLFVTDASKNIIGKIAMYDLVRGLVPEPAKKLEFSRTFFNALSSRAVEVAKEIGEMQERFQWVKSSFADLAKAQAHKKVSQIMTPVSPILTENDSLTQAIYLMFKENVREPLVMKNDKPVGVLNLMKVLEELLEVVGAECYVKW